MIKKPIYNFDSTSSTGIDAVPLNSIILVEDSGSGIPKQILYTDNTSVTSGTTINTLLTTMTSQWESLETSSELLDDTSPQLGGDLDVNGHAITGYAVLASPTFTGTPVLPSTTIIEVKTDTSPQLGGDLDVNGHTITGYATLASPTFTGTPVLPSTTVIEVKTDTTPQLGGNLDTNSKTINDVNLTGHITYDENTLTTAIDCSIGNTWSKTVGANFTQTFSNVPTSGTTYICTLKLYDAGDYTITWSTAIDWEGGSAPDFTSNGYDIVTLYTVDGGTIWYGSARLDYS